VVFGAKSVVAVLLASVLVSDMVSLSLEIREAILLSESVGCKRIKIDVGFMLFKYCMSLYLHTLLHAFLFVIVTQHLPSTLHARVTQTSPLFHFSVERG